MARDIHIRALPDDVAERFSRGARARGMNQATYLTRLLELHDCSRSYVNKLGLTTSSWLKDELARLGLQSVEV